MLLSSTLEDPPSASWVVASHPCQKQCHKTRIRIQWNSAITRSSGPSKIPRYSRDSLQPRYRFLQRNNALSFLSNVYLRLDVLVFDMFIVNSMLTLTTSGVIMLTLLKQSKTKPKLFFERIIKRMGSVKCDKTLNVPISYKAMGAVNTSVSWQQRMKPLPYNSMSLKQRTLHLACNILIMYVSTHL